MGDTEIPKDCVTLDATAAVNPPVEHEPEPVVLGHEPAYELGQDPAQEPELSTYDQLMARLFSARQLALDVTARSRMWGWLAPLLVAVAGGVLRFIRLGRPTTLVFDETYYVKNAYTMLKTGFENDWPENPNDAWNAGDLDIYLSKADYVVHPPLGKWMIAFGMWIGDPHNPFFWRFSTALVSVIAIFLIARVVRKILGSTLAGVAAGSLFAIDGMAIVHARTGLLDSFLMFFVVVAFVLLVNDRFWRRKRLARLVAGRLDAGLPVSHWGPKLGFSWWRFSAAFALGLSCGVKWSGVYYVAAFCLMAVLWDAGARKAVGVPRWAVGTFWREAVPSALIMLPTALAGYLLAWSSWFANPNAYDRRWYETNPGSYWSWLPDFLTSKFEILRSFWHYHQSMMTFHTGLSTEHTYQAQAWGWLLQLRPTSFYWNKVDRGVDGCGSDHCTSAVTSIGNPLIWWLGTLAFVYLFYRLFRNRDWIAGAICTGVIAGWVPWLFFPERTIFTFYAIAFAPFIYMALAYVGFLAWEKWSPVPSRRGTIIGVLVGVSLVIFAVSVFYYPIWTAMQVPYKFWQAHMWMRSWI